MSDNIETGNRNEENSNEIKDVEYLGFAQLSYLDWHRNKY